MNARRRMDAFPERAAVRIGPMEDRAEKSKKLQEQIVSRPPIGWIICI